MMLDYDWGNPAAAAAAMILFGEETQCQNSNVHDRQQVFDPYSQSHGLGMDFLQTSTQPQPISAAALFSSPTTGSCHQRYGLALPPVPMPARIGLNLGVRTYFASGPAGEEMMVGRVCRRRTRTARCQAEGCGADLTHAKHYHRRHKVCEFHSKASIVIAAGLSQRFCQQCSRFHVLSEFDQGKRSCRKRLADHNRRRRKSQDLTTSPVVIDTQNTTTATTTPSATNNAENIINNNAKNPEKPIPETCSSVTTHISSPPTCPMALGLSASSTAETSLFLSQLGEFRGHDHRTFPIWDEPEDGGIYQNK